MNKDQDQQKEQDKDKDQNAAGAGHDLRKGNNGEPLEGQAAEDPETQAQSDGTFLQSNPPQDGKDHGDGNVHQNTPEENTPVEDRDEKKEDAKQDDQSADEADSEGKADR